MSIVGHHISFHVGHYNVISTLCEGSETLTEWKSKSVTYLPRDGLTRVIRLEMLAHLKSESWS